ncbi:MAG: signal peptidase I [Myxococcota bacterium]
MAQEALEQEEAPEEELGLARRIWDQVGPLLLAVLIALGIRAVVIESYYVPSESMLPTLLIGDHVFVNKFVYGARVPFTDVHLPALRDPERGEIVVFALGRKRGGEICPLDVCPDARSEGFVKRVVGLPGDRVEYRHGVFYLNGAKVSAPPTGASFTDEGGRDFPVLREDLAGCFHDTLDHPALQGLSHAEFTVPEDHYYFLGDNRDNSNDSRGWGTVPRNDLRGPIIVNYWSWNNQRSWAAMLNPLTWLDLLWNHMRWDRIGMDHGCEAE